MIALIRTINGLCFTILIIGFAIMNRQVVPVFYSPLNESLPLPLYLVTLGMLGLGFVLGGALVWFNMESLRQTRRFQKKTIKSLEKELQALKNPPPPPSAKGPARLVFRKP